MESDKQLIICGLSMRKNFIQTGDCLMTPIDAKNCGESDKIVALTPDQMRLIIKIDDLIDKINTKWK